MGPGLLNAQQPQDAEEQWRLTHARFSEWLHEELFTWRWWLLLALFLLSAFLWWKLADKTKFAQIAAYTFAVMLFILALDELGEELTLWYYTVDIFFLFPPISAINISCLPLLYMLVYQRFVTWKSFALAMLVTSAVFCFVFEPLFVWGGVYVMLRWKSYYGFPIYIFIAFASKFIVQTIFSISKKAQKQYE